MKVTTSYRYLASVLLLYLGPSCLGQEITVRVINAANGRPLQKQAVQVSFLYWSSAPTQTISKKLLPKYGQSLDLETDVNGKASFRLPGPPPTHVEAALRVDESRWHSCRILAPTDDLLRKGIASPVAAGDSKKSAALSKPIPGQILLLAHQLSFFERLLYPVLKE